MDSEPLMVSLDLALENLIGRCSEFFPLSTVFNEMAEFLFLIGSTRRSRSSIEVEKVKMVNLRVKGMAMNLQVTLIFFEKLMKLSCLINIM